jgi:hypothetical protein
MSYRCACSNVEQSSSIHFVCVTSHTCVLHAFIVINPLGILAVFEVPTAVTVRSIGTVVKVGISLLCKFFFFGM